jgi:hypothetical protein
MSSEKIPRYLYPVEDEFLPIPHYLEINEPKIKSGGKIKRRTKHKRKNKKLKSRRKI